MIANTRYYTFTIKHINFSNNYFMQTDRIQKQKTSSYCQSAPKRSLSYNDLKKKRLLRSEKSKAKLKPQMSERIIGKTEKKKPNDHFSIGVSATSNTQSDIKKIEKSIHELKDVFDEIKQKAKTKKYITSKPFYTDRNVMHSKMSFIDKPLLIKDKVNAFYESIELAGNEKQLIKQIISKKKSQRRLLKFDQIRAELKRSKSKSKLGLIEDQTTTQSKINISSSQQKTDLLKQKKNIHVNKFETVKQKPLTYSITDRQSNTDAVQKYQTVDVANKEILGLKNQYGSRRKLNIGDFQTERRSVERKETDNSQGMLKFHRKLRKTNSEIVIKTKDMMYNKNKYMSRLQSKSTIIRSAQKMQKKRTQNTVNQERQKQSQQQKQKFSIKENIIEATNPDNIMPDLELSAINISEIQFRKQQSIADIQSELNFVQAIQAQQLEIQMKKIRTNDNQSVRNEFKKSFRSQKQNPKKLQLLISEIQNAENMENLSNILDFVALPTKQLKIKINKCSSKVTKKKNELQKFKKIFPMNFFNK